MGKATSKKATSKKVAPKLFEEEQQQAEQAAEVNPYLGKPLEELATIVEELAFKGRQAKEAAQEQLAKYIALGFAAEATTTTPKAATTTTPRTTTGTRTTKEEMDRRVNAILAFCKDDYKSVGEIAAHLSMDTKDINSALLKIKNEGKFQQIGTSKKDTKYKTKA